MSFESMDQNAEIKCAIEEFWDGFRKKTKAGKEISRTKDE
jgi:hypothetical protein